ncbi:MAG: hypothetical protein K0U29_01045 [Gammaproteobacteria bacterium]|nr:hypothetical protein [Gammaproteobacteria bacterium]
MSIYFSYTALISIIGYLLALTRISKIEIEKTFFIVIPAIILVLYAGGLLNILSFAANLIFVVGILLFFLSPWYVKKGIETGGQLFEKYITPGFICSLLFIVILQWLALHQMYWRWDEFTYWGPHIRYMYLSNSLQQGNEQVMRMGYPPGGRLFQYYYGRPTGFSEGVTYAAQTLLIYAPLVCFTANIKWKNWINAVLIACLGLVLFIVLHIKFIRPTSIYMDTPVGVYFGICLAAYYLSSRGCKNILFLVPAVCAMVLFKLSLMPFVFSIAVIILLDQLFSKNKQQEMFLKALLSLAVMLLAAYITKVSWSLYLRHIHVVPAWSFHVNISNVNQEILRIFLHAFFRQPMVVLAGFVVLISINIILRPKSDRCSLYILHGCLLLGFFIYFSSLLTIYLFGLGHAESMHLASFIRYSKIYYLGWGLVIFSGYVCLLGERGSKYPFLKYIVSSVLILMFAVGMFHQSIWQKAYLNHVITREGAQHITDNLGAYVRSSESIYVILDGSYSPFDTNFVNYNLIPYRYSEVKGVSKGVQLAQFIHDIRSYNYLLIACSDVNFWDKYQELFKKTRKNALSSYLYNGAKQNVYLYKITHDGDQVKLENMP